MNRPEVEDRECCKKWEEYHGFIVSLKDDMLSYNKHTERDVRRCERDNDALREEIFDLKKRIKEQDEVIVKQMEDIVEYRNEATKWQHDPRS